MTDSQLSILIGDIKKRSKYVRFKNTLLISDCTVTAILIENINMYSVNISAGSTFTSHLNFMLDKTTLSIIPVRDLIYF